MTCLEIKVLQYQDHPYISQLAFISLGKKKRTDLQMKNRDSTFSSVIKEIFESRPLACKGGPSMGGEGIEKEKRNSTSWNYILIYIRGKLQVKFKEIF